jgi:hypothetical protein
MREGQLMPEVRIFNPQYVARKGGEHAMAYKRKHHRRRRNPLGLSGGVVKDAMYTAVGAVGASALPGLVVPSFSTGWAGVGATAAAAVGISMLARMVGGEAAATETLKGGLAATVIKALHAAGIGSTIGMGLYAPSWFGIPTSSSQYLQTAAPGQTFNRGRGALYFPGPGSAAVAALPATAGGTAPAHLGYHRFRSRYAGSYG